MEKFLRIRVKGNIVEVTDCPHCVNQVDSQPSCFFITSYIQGFLDSLEHLPSTSVIQIQSKAMGRDFCSFKVVE